jgi:hypothetical protein
MGKKPNFEFNEEKPNYIRGVTPPFRASYPQLTEAKRVGEKDDPKFSIRMLFPKEQPAWRSDEDWERDQATMKLMRETAGKVAKKFFIKREGQKLPEDLKKPFKDGDAGDKPGEAGFIVANAKTGEKYKPEVVDQNKTLMDDERTKKDLYAGCWCRASISIAVTDEGGSKCVFIILHNVQKLRDDTRLAGGASADEDFDVVEYSEGQAEFSGDDDEDMNF